MTKKLLELQAEGFRLIRTIELSEARLREIIKETATLELAEKVKTETKKPPSA